MNAHFVIAMPKSKLGFLHEIFQNHAHEVSAFISGRQPKEQNVFGIAQESFLRCLTPPGAFNPNHKYKTPSSCGGF